MAHTKKSIYADLPQEFVLVAIYKLLSNFTIGKVWPFTSYLKLRHILILQFLNPLPKRQIRGPQIRSSLESIFDCLQTVDMGMYILLDYTNSLVNATFGSGKKSC